MGRFKKPRAGATDEKGGSILQAPDIAMTFMLLGAFCKFLELVVIRDGIHRYMSAALGGLMIAIGSGLVTWNSVSAIWQASREVSALQEKVSTSKEGVSEHQAR
uniref:Uncharacterized protein n=1 Tax=Neobodo designis TaxID=312471 RepID=A0A7S1R2V5_NEODS|mmetsp:Transcript_6987/g.21882  ORF Transcript_6987/g.21882 Transcript_6987/m.21882 type:complete len:104 (+) Transcript_6987:566-877(+)